MASPSTCFSLRMGRDVRVCEERDEARAQMQDNWFLIINNPPSPPQRGKTGRQRTVVWSTLHKHDVRQQISTGLQTPGG